MIMFSTNVRLVIIYNKARKSCQPFGKIQEKHLLTLHLNHYFLNHFVPTCLNID